MAFVWRKTMFVEMVTTSISDPLTTNAGTNRPLIGDFFKNKMAFTVGGPEKSYNQIRVINRTSLADFQCRVVYLNDDNSVRDLFGVYNLKGYDDTDSNANDLKRGYRIGIQMPKDCPIDVTFSIEYKDYPFYDAILIYVNEASSGYDDTF